MKFYVYKLIDPRTDSPFYIGKGKGDRAYSHHREKGYNNFKDNVINKILSEGKNYIVEMVYTGLSESDALTLETQVIKEYGRRGIDPEGILTNRTLGGEGLSGHVFSDEHRRKISESNKGHTRGCDHLHTPEVIAKRRESLLGYKHTDEARKKMSNAHIGKKQSAETKKKRSDTLSGYKHTKETKIKYSKSKTGKKNPNFGKKWYDNGSVSRTFVPGTEPDGFTLGRKILR